MSQTSESDGVIVVSNRNPQTDPVLAVFRAAPAAAGAKVFRTRDLNDVERAVASGICRRVVFARLEDLLEGCWDEQVRLDEWIAAGARVEVLDPPGVDGQSVARVVYESWRRWNQAQRRRRAVAGAILGALAALAAFGWILLCRMA